MSSEIVAAYDAHDRRVRVRYSKVAHVLVAVLVPAGTTLDWFVYPHLLGEFLVARLIVGVVAGIALGLHFGPTALLVERHIRWFAMLVPLLANAAMSWMILRSEGAVSPYYAGLNLVLMGIGVLLPWSFREVVIACMVSIAFYFGACGLHGAALNRVNILYNNAYFLGLTSIICSTSAYFWSKGRFEEFRLRSELAHSYKQVSELERLKTEFFANISHELRTPLTLILSPLNDVLSRGAELPHDILELLTLARNNSLRLLKPINDLLEVIRLESGELSLHAEPVDLDQFVRNQVESVCQLARMKGLELNAQPLGGPSWVRADPEHLEKILVNLLTNAIKFTPRGGSISVDVRQDAGTAVVEVRDTGIGISATELPHVFDRFRQADGSATRRFSGMGIGLSLAKDLSEKLGGVLSAESRPGEGSTFRLRLPSHEPARAEGTDWAPAERGEAEDSLVELFRDADRFVPVEDKGERRGSDHPSANSHGTVLVIDDEPDVRRYLATMLADRYAVLQAADGLEGLALARQARPELVILDLMMPNMDGWQVCGMLKQQAAEGGPKVIVVTARTDEMAKIAALERGADDFLGKPFSTLEVRTRLANLYRTHSLETSLRTQNKALVDAMHRLRSAEAQLVLREKMVAVSHMAGGVLHEINNPLNFTLTALGIALDRTPAESPLREILDDVQAGMLRIRDIVADLRDFATPDHRQQRELFDFNRVVDRALRLATRQLHGIRVEREVPNDCPTYGSESQVLQILTNLLLNAEEAVRRSKADREPAIRIVTAAVAGHTRVSVWDNGIGIPASLLDKVFDPFVTTRDVRQGMGLGLSICHTLVTGHGGTIAVRSEEGSWTEVTFDLPNVPTEGAA